MYGAQDPGNWQSFLKRQDNAGLPIMEAKSKFLQEQMNFDSLVNFATQAQTNTGGIAQNPLVSLIYGGSLNSTVGGFTSTVIATFTSPVTALYDPQLTVTNGQQGGGSSDAILYEYSTGTGTTALTFTHTQAPSATNTGAVAANVLTSTGSYAELVSAGGAVTEPTDATAGTYTNPAYTTSGAGTGAEFGVVVSDTDSIVLAANALTSSITVNTANGFVGAYASTPLVSTTGVGTGATVDVTITASLGVGAIQAVTAGSGYAIGDELTIAVGTLGSGIITTGVTQADFTSFSGGSGGTAATYAGVVPTGGTGTDVTFEIVANRSNGKMIPTSTVTNSGVALTGATPSQTIQRNLTVFGYAGAGTGATGIITSDGAGIISEVTIVDAGSGYSATDTLPITPALLNGLAGAPFGAGVTGGVATYAFDNTNILVEVVSATVDARGVNYSLGDALTFALADIGNPSSDFILTDLLASGQSESTAVTIILDALDLADGMDSITVTKEGTLFIPGEVITFDAGALGGTSNGGSVAVATVSLTGDVLRTPISFTYPITAYGQAAINNVSDNRPVQIQGALPDVSATAIA